MIKEEFIDKVLSRFAYYTEKDTQGALKDTYDRILTKRQQVLLLKLIKKFNNIILKNLFYKLGLDEKAFWSDEDFKNWYKLVDLYNMEVSK